MPPSRRARRPPPEAPASPLPRPPARDRGARPARDSTVFTRGVAPSWSDASWLRSDSAPSATTRTSPRETAWAQVGPWGAFALVSAFRLETDT